MIIALVSCLSKDIIKFVGLKSEAISIAKNYLIIRLFGCLVVPFEQIIQSHLKVINKNKQVMNIKISYTILNIIGDTLAVLNGYGAIGIAVSTVICEYIQVILLLIVNKGIKVRKIQGTVIKELLNIFKINIFSKLGHRLGVVVFTSLASNLEQNIYANYVLAIQVIYLGTSISEAIGEATLIRIGHIIGKNDKEKIQEAKQVSIYSSYIIAIIQLLIFLIFGKLLLSIISNNSYNNVAINLLYLFIIEMIMETLHYPFEGYLLALQEIKYVTIVNLTGVLAIRIISALIFLKLGLGIYGIALALILDYFVRYLRYICKVKRYDIMLSS
jgi:Na+-driven multidrug efflux pump